MAGAVRGARQRVGLVVEGLHREPAGVAQRAQRSDGRRLRRFALARAAPVAVVQLHVGDVAAGDIAVQQRRRADGFR